MTGGPEEEELVTARVLPPRYVPIRRIRTDELGTVYLARPSAEEGLVALRRLEGLDPIAVAALEQALRGAVGVQHPLLPARLGLVRLDDAAFLVTEFVDGQDALGWIRDATRRRMALQETVALDDLETLDELAPGYDEERLRGLLREVAGALAHVHERGHVHRGLAAGRIVVRPDRRAAILDFVLAAIAWDAREDRGRALAEDDLHVSPEQAKGAPAAPTDDAYALGVFLYRALAGRAPFQGTPEQILTAKGRAYPVPVSERVRGVPDDLDQLTYALLAPKAEDRPTMREVLARSG